MPISVASPRNASRLAPPLRAIVRATLTQEGCAPGDIAVVLTGDAALRELNRRWRGMDRATDVLSFAYAESDPIPTRISPHIDGDLVISLDRMTAQAKRFHVTPGRELARLVIHGALHLAGLDHQKAAERRHMREREEKALRAMRAHVRTLDGVLERGTAG
jgi:probable rRNA maturation factor